MTTAGQVIVDTLVASGARWASCVPGESFLPVIDGYRERADDARLVVFRHEAAAGQAAVAHGRRTGRAGVCIVTRGPGAMHAAIAVHTAQQDAVPLVLLVGQIDSGDRGRGAFQEFSSEAVFGSMAKWVVTLDRPDRAAETVARAVRMAESGRPGAVVIDLPEDVLYEEVAPASLRGAPVPVESVSSAPLVARIRELLDHAERPFVLLGRGGWSASARADLQTFAESNGLPVAVSFRCQDYIDNDSPSYIGHLGFAADPALRERVADADLVLAIGGHFGDVETDGYARRIGAPDATIVHVAASEFDLDRTTPADVAAIMPAVDLARALAGVVVDPTRWSEATVRARAEFERFATPQPGDDLGEMIAFASSQLPADAVIGNGAGNYAVWLHRFHRYHEFGTQLAPANGAMGFGIPAAIAAAVDAPNSTVVAYAGDGCFMMSSAELATIAAQGLRIVLVVVDNGILGTIRAHQRRRFPDGPYATDLVNPDFVALAAAFGIAGTRVSTADEFRAALTSALRSEAASLIHVVTDPAVLVPIAAPAAPAP